ncbi:hypothetical protein [Amnibacterium setariae]|uniref:Uncharacterized protein n=1 Tax=Amnibacterium setariae TaxID=2306585 RepID=A0A3A1TWT8_9MICO|nr:hypothetical protein [Amnibacterium setariae]RIX28250.1 hypothetical protein D1781_12365 [Amnibacterium setariae]
MDIANVIALGAFLLSAVGASVALWQAGIASRARADAQAANAAAADHEAAALRAAQEAASAANRSAEEAKRSADALEEANELARAAMPKDRWKLTHVGGVRYSVQNVSGGLLMGVVVVGLRSEDDARVTMDGERSRDVVDGESVTFTVFTASSMGPATVVVGSVDVNGVRDRFTRTIS